LRWTKLIISSLAFVFLACELPDPEAIYDNPLDGGNTFPSALVFVPEQSTTNLGGSVAVEVYAFEVTGVAGIHAQIQYDNTKLGVSTVSPGTFFSDAQAPGFVWEADNGILDIYTFYMGSDGAKDGTGPIATVVFTTSLPGNTNIEFTAQSELRDSTDGLIQLNELGTGTVSAQ